MILMIMVFSLMMTAPIVEAENHDEADDNEHDGDVDGLSRPQIPDPESLSCHKEDISASSSS